MNKIVNVEGLVKRLNMCTGDYCYLDVMKSMDIPEREFEPYYHWSDEHYTRNRVIRTDKYELVLICWEKGQQSYIHDYASNEAWIHPLRGKLREERFILDKNGNLEKVSNVLLGTEEFSYMCHNMDIHRYSNVYESRSVSLHLYAKPVDEWNIYTEESGDTGKKEVWWDSIAQAKG